MTTRRYWSNIRIKSLNFDSVRSDKGLFDGSDKDIGIGFFSGDKGGIFMGLAADDTRLVGWE